MKIVSLVLCAGKSDRLKSRTSKMLHEISGWPIACWSVRLASQISNVPPIVVLGHQAEEIKKKLENEIVGDLSFVTQQKLDGTGGAVKAAIDSLPDDCDIVIVMCGDVPLLTTKTMERLIALKVSSALPIAFLTSRIECPAGYGRILRDDSQKIQKIIEEADASPKEKSICEINSGIYAFSMSFLKKNIFSLNNDNKKGEFYLTDLINHNAEALSAPYEEIFGINDRAQLARAQSLMNRRIINFWMEQGASFIDPRNTLVDAHVKLSKDCVIYPQVHLQGRTKVGISSVIKNGSIIKDCDIGCDVIAEPYSVCDQAIIKDHSRIGPFAHLRRGTILEEGVKIGNFVETKASHLKKGVKANHLAYIGDAEVGEETNIGAGSITCNYDGKTKQKTTIGKKAFIGSNTTLIAPLRVGDGAYIAGGSTISKEVPAGALAFGRARQKNREKKIV